MQSELQPPQLTVSIVSHGQASLLRPLVEQLVKVARQMPLQVIVTENLGDRNAVQFNDIPLTIDYVVNTEPKGFGANHNAAFSLARAPYFCVLNPDIRLSGNPFMPLVQQLRKARGIAGPKVINPSGELEDSARHIPTISKLLKRHVKGVRIADYRPDHIQQVDWMAGMCLVFDVDVYRALQGFDERFHLYCEDIDVCLRAHLAGWDVTWVVDAIVEHQARRDSRRKLRYLWWHLNSFTRLVCSTPYRLYRKSMRHCSISVL